MKENQKENSKRLPLNMMRDSKNCTKVRYLEELLFKQKKNNKKKRRIWICFHKSFHHSWMMLDKAFFFFWPQCITQEFGALFQRNEVNGVLTVFTSQSDI